MSLAVKTTIIAAVIAGLAWLVQGFAEQGAIAALVTGLIHGVLQLSPVPGPERDKPMWLSIVTGGLFTLWAIYVAVTGDTSNVRI